MDIQLPPIRITPPDLTEANEALAKMTETLRGLKMYSAAEIEAIKADAFDEGFTACAGEHTRQRNEPTYPIHRSNPYRTTK